MLGLWAAAAFFLGIHLLISGTRLRDRLVATVGEWPYLGLFSAASIGGIVWLAVSYNEATMEPDRLYWVAPVWIVHLAPLFMLIAFLFAVTGLTTPNPTAFRSEGSLESGDGRPKGVVHITRHPFLWGVMIWATVHIIVNGDRASIIFFGTFLLLAALGTLSIDEKRRRNFGEHWDAFARVTSNVPFAAILAGRTRFRFTEDAWWRILASIIAFALVLVGHLWLFGVSPIPGWQPY
jgi:uncharacterized membrane protein